MFHRRKTEPSTSPSDASDPPAGTDRRDTDALATVYARFADRIYAYALQRLHDPDLADDITSTVFTRALAKFHTFVRPDTAADAALEGWLLAITRNVLVDYVRADRRLTILDADTYRQHVSASSPDPADAPVAPDEQDQLLAAMDALSVTQQRIVLLRLQGWNGAEIADLLGMSHSAVRTAQHRAYSRLREVLTADHATSPTFTPEQDHA